MAALARGWDGLPARLVQWSRSLIPVVDRIFKRSSDGARMLSNLSFRSPSKMIDTEDNRLIGLEAELVSDGHNLT